MKRCSHVGLDASCWMRALSERSTLHSTRYSMGMTAKPVRSKLAIISLMRARRWRASASSLISLTSDVIAYEKKQRFKN